MHLKDSPHPYAMTTILFWGMAYPLTRTALPYFSVYSLGFLRYTLAALILLAVALFQKMPPPARGDLPWFFLSGATGFSVYSVVFNIGCSTVSAATGSVVLAIVPVITALMARVVFRQTLLPVQWLAIFMGLAGVAVLAVLDGGGISLNAGILWLLLGALLLGVYNLVQRKLTASYSALQVTTYSLISGSLMLCIFAPSAIPQLLAAPPRQHVTLLVLGVLAGSVAYLTWTKAFSKAKQVASVSNYMFVTPFLASFFGWLWAGETIEGATLAGGAIILSGLLLFSFGPALLLPREKKPQAGSAAPGGDLCSPPPER